MVAVAKDRRKKIKLARKLDNKVIYTFKIWGRGII